MQQRFRKLALFVGAATLAAGGLVIVACSAENVVTTPTFDSGGGGGPKEGGGGGGPEAGMNEAGPQPDGGGADAAADCGTPAKLFPPTADGGIFCPFSGPPGKNISCLDTEQCCENAKGAGVSTCAPKGSVCPVAGATVWECEDPANCPAGQKCCAHSSAAGTAVTVSSGTCGTFLSKFSGTKCAAACATGELVVCEQQSECTTGTCTAVRPKNNSIGVCN